MFEWRHRLDEEVQGGLVTALSQMALTRREIPYVVISTAPSQWLPERSGDPLTILDIGSLSASSRWPSEADLLDRLVDMILAAGWPRECVDLSRAVRGADRASRADVLITDDKGTAVAVVEVRLSKRHPSQAVAQTVEMARRFNVRYGLIFDSTSLLLVDASSPESAAHIEEFPDPKALGARVGGQTGAGALLFGGNSENCAV